MSGLCFGDIRKQTTVAIVNEKKGWVPIRRRADAFEHGIVHLILNDLLLNSTPKLTVENTCTACDFDVFFSTVVVQLTLRFLASLPRFHAKIATDSRRLAMDSIRSFPLELLVEKRR